MEKLLVGFAKDIVSTNPFMAYIFFFFNAVLQIVFPPYPGDTITILEGYLSSKGHLNSFFLLLATLSGTYLSSIFLYIISYKFGERIVSNNFIKKYFDISKIYKLENWFKKYGPFVIIINKFLPGIGSLTLIAAGLFRLPPIPAFVSIGTATVIHNTFLFMAGRLTGDNMDLIRQIIREYNRIIISAAAIVSIIYLYVKFVYIKKKSILK